MPNILIVTGSVRPNSVNEKVVPLVKEEVEKLGATAIVADLKTLDLPFFDDSLSPTNPDFAPTDERVLAWTKHVTDADGVVFVSPVYNHTLSPVQINAIDWIGKEWEAKPIALVGYGWGEGANYAHETARNALGVTLKANVADGTTALGLMQDLNPDGTTIDDAAVRANISATVAQIIQ